MEIWTPWKYEGMPSVGDYIQAEGYYEHFESFTWKDEGLVAVLVNGVCYFENETYEAATNKVVERWRKRIIGISNEVSKHEFLELTK